MKSRSMDTGGVANKATWGFQRIHEFLGLVNRGSAKLPELTFLFELESRAAHIFYLISIHMNNH